MRLSVGQIVLAALLAWGAATPSFAATAFAEARVSVGSDDAEQAVGATTVSLSSSDLELVTDGSAIQRMGIRFPALAIPKGAFIVDAWVQFAVDEVSTDVAMLSIRAQAADDGGTFSNANSVASRPLTAASVGWTPPAWPIGSVGSAGADQRTPSLASLVHEVVSRPGWSSGNALVLIITGSGRRTAESVEGDATRAALLHVEYDAGDINQTPTVALTEPADHAMFGPSEAVVFAGSASDPEDGDLGPALAWVSNRDGPIGFGGAFTSSSLSTGLHTLTASVSDSEGAIGSATRQIEIASGRHVLVGAGDIASCSSTRDSETAALLDGIFGTVFTLGDNAYPNGTLTDFTNCYGPSWGRHKERTRPASGNHDYNTSNAAGYFAYFGEAAGAAPSGLYSYDVAGWHVVVLNSECSKVGGCTRASPQGQWLAADLAAHPSTCTLAITHKARFGSGPNGDHTTLTELWELLYEARADVVLSGHDHNYERFDPQDPNGQADPARGIRQFIVGTGGNGLSSVGPPHANSVISNGDSYGVLELTLRPNRYEWAFVPVAGGSFRDTGSADCVVAPAPPLGCGIGPELALLLPILGALGRRRSTHRPYNAT